MQILRPASEDEVLECFVHAERDSERYGKTVQKLLARIPDNPRAVLSAYRSWPDQGLFGGFPRDVRWYRASLSREEVLDILYIDWDWWLRITDGTRRPRDAAARVRAGLVPGVEPDEGDERIAQAASTNPPLIAVRAAAGERIVLLEGHVRLTAYALFPEHLPPQLEIYLGESERMVGWSEY